MSAPGTKQTFNPHSRDTTNGNIISVYHSVSYRGQTRPLIKKNSRRVR